METIDRAQEFRRLKELYTQKSDEELADIAAEGYELTDLARQALECEISSRRAKIQIATEPPEPEEEPEPESETGVDPDRFDPETLNLVPFNRFWDREGARKTMEILHLAGIPCYLDEANLESVDLYSGNFDRGVYLKVRHVDSSHASQTVRAYWQQHEQGSADEDSEYVPPTCPKCHSEEVVLEERESSTNPDQDGKYRWSCDSCGHEWTDDGIVP